MVRADGGDQWLVGDDLSIDAGRLAVGVTDQPKVDPAVLQSGDDLVRAVFEQRDLDIWVLVVEAGQQARQVHGRRRHRWDRRYGHVAAQQPGELVDSVADRGDGREGGAGVGNHGGTNRGQAHATG